MATVEEEVEASVGDLFSKQSYGRCEFISRAPRHEAHRLLFCVDWVVLSARSMFSVYLHSLICLIPLRKVTCRLVLDIPSNVYM